MDWGCIRYFKTIFGYWCNGTVALKILTKDKSHVLVNVNENQKKVSKTVEFKLLCNLYLKILNRLNESSCLLSNGTSLHI